MTSPSFRLIANYLPQFHPIPENDAWWGKGFTEWTNVARATPLFPGHYQPRVPADLGFYDLRVPEVRVQQAEMAREHGIEAFCYWHYWFGGKLLLERPLEEVIKSGEPKFPFCVAWANETWSGIWYGAPERILIEQTYPDEQDHINHFYYLLPAFADDRYIKVDGKPLFMVFRPDNIPNLGRFLDLWRELAVKAGLKGLHIIAYKQDNWPAREFGFDGATWAYQSVMRWASQNDIVTPAPQRPADWPADVYNYADAVPYMHGPKYPNYPITDDHYPSIVTGWDNSPRSGNRAVILHNYTPDLFRTHVKNVLARVKHKPMEHRIVFVKSWNEWAEGNYLEPDQRYGKAFLQVLKEEVYLGKNLPTSVEIREPEIYTVRVTPPRSVSSNSQGKNDKFPGVSIPQSDAPFPRKVYHHLIPLPLRLRLRDTRLAAFFILRNLYHKVIPLPLRLKSRDLRLRLLGSLQLSPQNNSTNLVLSTLPSPDTTQGRSKIATSEKVNRPMAQKLDAVYFARRDPLIQKLIERIWQGEKFCEVLQGFNAQKYDERVVEYSFFVDWLLKQESGLDILDVGCVLNNKLVSNILSERCRQIWLSNVVIEPGIFLHPPVSYHIAPLDRAFPGGEQFSLITCLSTIEHIGYDNSQYGSKAPGRYTEPTTEPLAQSLQKLSQLLRPGGKLLVSLPFGYAEVLIHPVTGKIYQQVFDLMALQEGVAVLEKEGVASEFEVFAISNTGWNPVDAQTCNIRYADGCPAASAVAFIKGERKG